MDMQKWGNLVYSVLVYGLTAIGVAAFLLAWFTRAQ